MSNEPMFDSIEALLAHQLVANQQDAEVQAAAVVRQLEREGHAVTPGLADAIAWRLLQRMNAETMRLADCIGAVQDPGRPALRAVH